VSDRARRILLLVAVATALADSSVVTLALPDILRHFDTEIGEVSRVLTSYNAILALGAIPAAYLAQRRPQPVAVTGIVVFGVASAVCGLAGNFNLLLGARCIQAVGGALLNTAALELLSITDGEAPAARSWAAAGVAGAAVGPAVGGALTQLAGWEWIFLLQAPIALAALLAIFGRTVSPAFRTRGFVRNPHLPALGALTLLSAALTAALFLLVLLLVEGWRIEPLEAAAIVSAMPVAAFAAPRVGVRGAVPEAAIGSLLVAGGLLALGLLPGASPWWTLPPQVLIGLGLGLAVTALTHAALAGRSPQAIHGGWTIAARHAGVVLGLIVLVPIFQADLDKERDQALQAGTAIVLDAPIPPTEKIGVARDVVRVVDAADRRIPDISSAFTHRKMTPALEAVRTGLLDELDRAATHAFSRSFLAGGALALAALLVVLLGRREIEL
jgi:MFS family permease